MKKLSLILAAFLSLGAVTGYADDIVILEKTASDFDTWGARPDGRERVLSAISRETGVPITTLEMQRNNTRLGYGGLFIANSLATATGHTFDEIAALKASGHGWGWIAKQNNVKLGPIVSRARNVDKAFKKSDGKVKKVKKAKEDKFLDDDDFDRGNGNDRGPAKMHGHDKGPKGPKAPKSFKAKGKGH